MKTRVLVSVAIALFLFAMGVRIENTGTAFAVRRGNTVTYAYLGGPSGLAWVAPDNMQDW